MTVKNVAEFSTFGLKVKDKVILCARIGKMLAHAEIVASNKFREYQENNDPAKMPALEKAEIRRQMLSNKIFQIQQEIIHEVGIKRYRELLSKCTM